MIADRYEVGEMIGRGGMAEVFAGVDRRLDRQVAIKLLLPAMAARSDIRLRFEAEARAAASLSHPNAVAVFDTGEHDGVPFIVMERLGGETLGDRMAAGLVEPAWLVTVATKVLGALGAAHAAGLIHRDIKPGNILLTADGGAKVADFGIAKSLDSRNGADLTVTGQVLGTPAYLAPELLDGAAAGPRSDLWALGVTLYEALAGFKPFGGTTALASARAVAEGAHQPLAEARPGLDAALVSVIERAMARDPAARFASADEMAGALRSTAVAAPTLRSGAAPAVADSPTVADFADDTGGAGTLVLDADDLAGPATVPPPAAPSPGTPRARPVARRRVLIGVAVAGVAVLTAFLLARAASNDRSPVSVAAGPTSTGAKVTTTVAPTTDAPGAALAQQLRDAAGRLSSGNGVPAANLAARLEALADQVQSGGGGAEATALVAATIALSSVGQVDPGTAANVVQLLARVPGVDQGVVDKLSAALARPTTAPDPTRPQGKERKGKD